MTTEFLGKSWTIKKAWINEDGSVNVEGWVSTNNKDRERDIIEPEAFGDGTLDGYFDRGAPISCEHNTDDMPVGYMLKSALVRDGQVFHQINNTRHPTADFKYFDESEKGTGWYGLGVIDEPRIAKAANSGKLSSFSFIGQIQSWTPLDDGGKLFKAGDINPLLEATITAYPINPTAIMRIAKSYGYPVRPASTPIQPRLMLTPEGVERILQRNK